MRSFCLRALFVAMFFSCAHTRTATSSVHADIYYPRAIGNQWVYEVSMLGEKQELVIRQVEEKDGFIIDTQGAKLKVDAYGLRDDKRYLLREPLVEGTEWSNVVSASSLEKYRITQTGTECRAGAVSVRDCIWVEGRNRVRDNTFLVTEWTFAPHIGIVEIRTSLDQNGRVVPQTQISLKTYAIANSSK